MGIRKLKQIKKAFETPLPTGEKWYEDRLKICAGCPLNSANIESSSLTMVDRIQMRSGVCDNGNHCTACHCCIERKASLRESECGLAEIGQKPKWEKLEVENFNDKDMLIVNLTPDQGKITSDKSGFIYDLGDNFSDNLVFSFQLKRSGGLNVKSYNGSCSCTVTEMQVVDNSTVQFDMNISTANFREGTTTRTLKVFYIQSRNVVKEVLISFKVNKNVK